MTFRKLLALVVLSVLAFAQETAKPSEAPKSEAAKAEPKKDFKMKMYQMVFMYGTDKPAPTGDEGKKMQAAHLASLAKLHKQRVNMIYGPMLGGGNLKGIAIMDAPNKEAAMAFHADDPYIAGGYMRLEAKPWYGPEGWFSEASTDPIVPDHYIFGFLKRGPNRSQTKEEAQALQKGHLDYMDGLHKQGKLVVAGPFGEDGDLRGIVIYKVKTVAEANELAAGDPMVKVGRLAIETHPWMTLKGILK